VKWLDGLSARPRSAFHDDRVFIPAVRAAAWHAAGKPRPSRRPFSASPPGTFVGEGAGAGRTSWRVVCAKLRRGLVATGERAKDYDGTDPRIFGVQFAEVVVDVETGIVRVEKIVAVHDCGLPVWKSGVESQIRGGILQGISYALFEERAVDLRSGRVMNPNLEFYKIPARRRQEIVPVVLGNLAGRNNTQTRGVGGRPRSDSRRRQRGVDAWEVRIRIPDSRASSPQSPPQKG
jgi:xanthine dehydrogenase YagR molybdenum-binding subunit